MARLGPATVLLALMAHPASAHDEKLDDVRCHYDTASSSMHCHDEDWNILPWPPVKKSRKGICHDRESPWYERTIHFEPFRTIEACIESGGRLPAS